MKNERTFFLIFGGVFFIVGAIFGWAGWIIGRQAHQLADIPRLDLVALENSSVGTQGVIEGRVAERNPLQFRTFVAYNQDVYQGEDCDDDGCDAIWEDVEQVTPPLWLDLPAGRVKISNGDYSIGGTSAEWESIPRRIAYKTQRYRGFEINDSVFAVGQVAPADGGPAFQAESISSGTRSDQVASNRVGSYIFMGMGALFCLIGGGVLGWLVIGLAR